MPNIIQAHTVAHMLERLTAAYEAVQGILPALHTAGVTPVPAGFPYAIGSALGNIAFVRQQLQAEAVVAVVLAEPVLVAQAAE